VHVSRLDVNSSLKDTSGRSGTGRHQNRARGFLVVSEIALAVILLVGAALMIRTFASLRAVNPGFDPHNVLTLQTSLSGGRYGTTAKVDNLIRQMAPRLESLPGVQSAATAIMLPIEGGIDLPFNIEGKPPAKGDKYNGDEQWRSVSAHYFRPSRFRSCGDASSPNTTPETPPAWSSSIRPWRRNIGKRRIPSAAMTIGKGLGPDFEEPAREIVGHRRRRARKRLTDANQGVMYVPDGQVTDGLTQLANKVIPLSWIVRTSRNPRP
jgi:putative ABC transport system permease protein